MINNWIALDEYYAQQLFCCRVFRNIQFNHLIQIEFRNHECKELHNITKYEQKLTNEPKADRVGSPG